ncbi:MAG: aminoacyl-tRNA hydrolase [Johnsonella sp.]|nr:aminoacyl-tRNA hydrolase [Johnsonella sp.]
MKIIAGLGNPGREYAHTRHNAGFKLIDELAGRYGIEMNEKKHKAICGRGVIEGEKVILMKPQTYMNRSGESIRAAMDFYKLLPEDIIVVFDDISLDAGQLRIRKKGSAGGHNGIKSIISHLGSMDFPRIKIGVGGKPEGYDLADYVLSGFQEGEKKLLALACERGADALKIMLSGDTDRAMNLYNQKMNSEDAE